MRLLTLFSTLFMASAAFAGSPDEDPIARAYRDRFEAANTPTFAQVLLNRPGRTTDEYRGFWTNCHQRTLEDGNFNSNTTRFRFVQRTPEILLDSDYGRGQEYYFIEGELQNIRTIEVEVSRPNTEIKLKTKLRMITSIRVEANGNLILENAFVPTDLAPYPEYGTLALGAGSRYRTARVSNYTVCQPKDLL